MRKPFYEFKNLMSSSADLYIYGEIVLEEKIDWWTGEKDKTAVDLIAFKEQLEKLEGTVNVLNIFINSPGGDVFVASTMVSMLERFKETGVIINAYVDGISASAASYLMMVANNIYLYKNSVVMIHKPMSISYGNVDDMQKTIDMLNKIEDSVLIPLYENKAKIDSSEIKELLAAETWFSAEDMKEKFDVTILSSNNIVLANIDKNVINMYKNVPEFVKNLTIQKTLNDTINAKNDVLVEKDILVIKNIEEKNITNHSQEELKAKEELRKNKIKTKLNLISNLIKMKGRNEI